MYKNNKVNGNGKGKGYSGIVNRERPSFAKDGSGLDKRGGFGKKTSRNGSSNYDNTYSKEQNNRDDSKRGKSFGEDSGRGQNSKDSYKKRENFRRNDGYGKDYSKNQVTREDFRKGFEEESKFNRNFKNEEDQLDNLNLEGRNAVLEALNHDRPIDKILVKKGGIEGTLKVIAAKAGERRIAVQEVDKQKLDMMSQTGNHQGIIAICPAHEYASVEDMIEKAKNLNEEPFIVILDGITDPYNLGAIIRTAECCGIHGVVIPKRRAASLTAIVSKTASGALEHVMVARVPSLTKVIDDLKKQGLWVACADMDGEKMYESNLKGAIAIVIGAEGEGVGRLIKEKCDFVVNIPLFGKIEALNASVAAGVLMYEAVRQRGLAE